MASIECKRRVLAHCDRGRYRSRALWAPNDESIALQANKLVRSCLDKQAITYDDYKIWRKKNPLIFTSVVDGDNSLIGFFDVFPLTREAGEGIIAGTLSERSLTTEHLVPLSETPNATHIHFATLLTNPRQRAFPPLVARETLLFKLKQFIEQHYAPVGSRTYTGYAQTKFGKALLRRSGFVLAVFGKNNKQRLPLYFRHPTGTASPFLRFDRTAEYLSAARIREARIKELDTSIETIELKMRSMIHIALNGDRKGLPPHVVRKIEERILAETNKNAAFDTKQFEALEARLQYCDLREIQDTITNRLLWPTFQARFINKEALGIKFDQLATLRNCIRHSRKTDEIALKEGEAAVLWFGQVLWK